MSKSLTYRKDTRTVEKFKKDVATTTARENRLMQEWAAKQCCSCDFFEYDAYSPGRDGEFLGKTTAAPDFKVTVMGGQSIPDGEYPVELKYTPCPWKATFKRADLEAYIKHAGYVLLIFGDGFEVPKSWVLVSPRTLRRMLDKLEVRSDYPGMGGKPAVMVTGDDLVSFFGQQHAWNADVNLDDYYGW